MLDDRVWMIRSAALRGLILIKPANPTRLQEKALLDTLRDKALVVRRELGEWYGEPVARWTSAEDPWLVDLVGGRYMNLMLMIGSTTMDILGASEGAQAAGKKL